MGVDSARVGLPSMGLFPGCSGWLRWRLRISTRGPGAPVRYAPRTARPKASSPARFFGSAGHGPGQQHRRATEQKEPEACWAKQNLKCHRKPHRGQRLEQKQQKELHGETGGTGSTNESPNFPVSRPRSNRVPACPPTTGFGWRQARWPAMAIKQVDIRLKAKTGRCSMRGDEVAHSAQLLAGG